MAEEMKYIGCNPIRIYTWNIPCAIGDITRGLYNDAAWKNKSMTRNYFFLRSYVVLKNIDVENWKIDPPFSLLVLNKRERVPKLN